MSKIINICIIEPSLIIRKGLTSLLNSFSELKLKVSATVEYKKIIEKLNATRPDILIINPTLVDSNSLSQIKSEFHGLKTIAITGSYLHKMVISEFDEVIFVNDSAKLIQNKITKIANLEETEEKKELSDREKEIIILLVKGLTNKEMAEQLCLSPHTIITHRRNIVNKLDIQTISGLTIYAIVNKMISLEEIKQAQSRTS